MSASGRHKASVTARTRCGLVKFRESGELPYGRRFPLKLKGAIYRSYVRLAILHRNEAWCLKECEMGILHSTEIHGESNVWSAAQRQKRSMDFTFILGLKETIDQLDMANSVRWYCYVLRQDGHV